MVAKAVLELPESEKANFIQEAIAAAPDGKTISAMVTEAILNSPQNTSAMIAAALIAAPEYSDEISESAIKAGATNRQISTAAAIALNTSYTNNDQLSARANKKLKRARKKAIRRVLRTYSAPSKEIINDPALSNSPS